VGSLELYVSSDNSYMKSRGDDSGLWIGTRFSSDRQLSQLSGWVRPKLKMYSTSLDAVRDFRSFITKAMADPTLAVQVLSSSAARRGSPRGLIIPGPCLFSGPAEANCNARVTGGAASGYRDPSRPRASR